MKILLVAGVDLALPGGLETHVIELARGLTARGHDVTVLGRVSSPLPLPAPANALRVTDAADPKAFEIVHHHGGPWPRPWDANALGPARYLKTHHFSVAAKMGVYLRMGRYQTLFNLGNHRALGEERAALARAGGHIAVSRSLRDELVRFHGAARESIDVIPNGASFEPPGAGRRAWRERNDIAPEAPVLLTIGRDDFVKGFDLLAKAWSASSLPPRATWVRIGGARAARSVTSGTQQITTGPIPPSDVREWIHASDVGAFPSYYEGGGIALTDMLAGGLYVLTHAVGVAPEAIRPGENGEFVPRRADAWAAALARALAAPPRLPGPGLSAEWSWNAMVERVETVYQRLRNNLS